METLHSILVWVIAAIVVGETIISVFHDLKSVRTEDSVTNIFLGLISLTIAFVMKGVTLGIFLNMQHHAFYHFEFTLTSFLLLFIISDFHYYAFHFISHKVRFFWASHVVHHSSHEYNFSVGIRMPFSTGLYRFIFWTPLAFAGFPAEMVILMDSLVVYYTFFLHTESIGKLGWFEKVFNSPSHHRVHHSNNKQYLDKNFGGVLILWDRIFGTYVTEEEKTSYGLTTGFKSDNPVKITFNEWKNMVTDLKIARTVNDVVKIIFGKPGWKPDEKIIRLRKTKFSFAKIAALFFVLLFVLKILKEV